jgi:hypothetical protein
VRKPSEKSRIEACKKLLRKYPIITILYILTHRCDMGFRVIGLTVVGVICTLSTARAGLLSDWGVTVADNNASTYGVPNGQGQKPIAGGKQLLYHSEDTGDTQGHGFFLDPNYGGQDYDAEFMGVVFDGSKLQIAIVTGQRPDNGFSYFAPGDIRIVTSIGVYGVEVGGGNGGGSGSSIAQGAPGATYTLNSNGFTIGVSTSGVQVAGSLWKDPVWILDPIAPQGATQMQFVQGTFVDTVDSYSYTRNDFTTQHAVIEMTLDASADFGAGTIIESIHWRPACGNDELNVLVNGRVVAPEASTIVSWSLVALGCALATWRRSKQGALRQNECNQSAPVQST